ncbi:hypothetical protein [Persephonella sp.]|nr:hypothetical protein [Aquificota bacterium]
MIKLLVALFFLFLFSCGGRVGVSGQVELNRNFEIYLNKPGLNLKIK